MYVFVGQELFLDNPESKQRNLDALRESRIAPPMEYRNSNLTHCFFGGGQKALRRAGCRKLENYVAADF
jgi:hypothetical protein